MQNLVLHATVQTGYTGIKLQWSERTAQPLSNYFLVGVLHAGLADRLWSAFRADEARRSELGSRHDFFNDLQREYGHAGRTSPGRLQSLIAPRIIVNIEPKGSRLEGGRISLLYAETGSILFIDTLKSVVPHTFMVRPR